MTSQLIACPKRMNALMPTPLLIRAHDHPPTYPPRRRYGPLGQHPLGQPGEFRRLAPGDRTKTRPACGQPFAGSRRVPFSGGSRRRRLCLDRLRAGRRGRLSNHRYMAMTTGTLKRRVNRNAHGYTPADIYAAMGQTAAAAVQNHIIRADAAIVALAAGDKCADRRLASRRKNRCLDPS